MEGTTVPDPAAPDAGRTRPARRWSSSRRTAWIAGLVALWSWSSSRAPRAAAGVGATGAWRRRASWTRRQPPASTTRTTASTRIFVGGGVAAFDCDDDGCPDLYLAGGERAGRAVPQRQPDGRSAAIRAGRRRRRPTWTAVTGAYPLDIDGDGDHRPGGAARRRERPPARASATAGSSERTSAWGFDGGDGWTMAFSATWEATRPADPGVRRTTWADAAGDPATYAAPDNELVRPAADGDGYGAADPARRPAVARCRCCSATGTGPGGATCASATTGTTTTTSDGEEQLWRIEPGAAAARLHGRRRLGSRSGSGAWASRATT